MRPGQPTPRPSTSQPHEAHCHTMLEFLMYKLEAILPEDEFSNIMSKFSIGEAQSWLEKVKDLVGIPCYDEIKEEFRASEEEKRRKLSEMNCFAKRKACGSHQTIFQEAIGADRHVVVNATQVDDMFTGYFVGV